MAETKEMKQGMNEQKKQFIGKRPDEEEQHIQTRRRFI